MKLYIAGPMTGLPEFNYPAFNKAAEQLRAAGYEVLNPTEVDDGSEPGSKPWDWYMRRTIRQVTEADAIALLEGWEHSRGAILEVRIANALRLRNGPVEAWIELAAQKAAA